MFLCLFAVKGIAPVEKTGENLFHIWVNGREVGALREEALAEELLVQARRNIASACDEMVFMEAEMVVEGEEVLWGAADGREDVLRRMEEALRSKTYKLWNHSYTVKVNDAMLSLACIEDVHSLLQTAVDRYDREGRFVVELTYDAHRKFGALTAQVVEASRQEEEELRACMSSGVQSVFTDIVDQGESDARRLGIWEMGFSDEIEIVEAYLPYDQLTGLSEAVELMLAKQETSAQYEVEEGDVLSAIALLVDTPVSRLVELNDSLENENTILHIGDRLNVDVSEPRLSVTRVEEKLYEEAYDAEVVYIDNDDWYTSQKQVIRQPSSGRRRILAKVFYENDYERERVILEEEIIEEAVAKVVERGTRIPPTYIMPVAGGVLTSGFGGRNAPVRGASTNHKGVDWSVPSGTCVYASCGGTVSKAGWGSGYGYVVYIEHEDGRQTRYGHLSKVLVKAGQEVKQGEQIALSGSTGNVTGPHLHFEILIGGVQVDPQNYLED